MAKGAEAFNRELSAAVRSMTVETGIQDTLELAVRSVVGIVGACDMACISIVGKGGIDTPAATDEATRVLDELQYELQEGPCFDAIRLKETVHVPDLANDGRWPTWGPKAVAELGVRSMVSYRLFVAGDTTGALSLYSRSSPGFDTTDLHQGLALAAHVAVAAGAALNVEHLEKGLVGRTVIGQAEGILMERFGLSADRAFQVLVRMSSQGNVKLHKVAEELVRTRIVELE